MEDTIPLHWCLSNNIGDSLNYWLIKKITKKEPIWVPKDSDYYKTFCIGSILNWADDNCGVWGSGLANQSDEVNPLATIHLTRGPVSDKIATECGAKTTGKWGDPALLTPMHYNKKMGCKNTRVGIVPHYIDYHYLREYYPKDLKTAWELREEDFKIINVFDPIEKIVDEMGKCQSILSSSLHGLILADAYGIPNKQIKITNLLGGDGTKFFDYFLSVDRKYELPTDFCRIVKYSAKDISGLIKKDYNHIKLDKIQKTIMSECPFI